jgi:putative transport protein
MNWFVQLFTGSGVAHDILVYSLVIALGIKFGQIRIAGITLGISCVLFFAIFFANLHLTVNPETNRFLKEFGLSLFVYCIGLEVGPRFFYSLREGGLKLNVLAMTNVCLGVLISILFHLLFIRDISATVGIMSGAVTNTPGLGAAQEAMLNPVLRREGLDPTQASVAFAVTYPIGVLGILFVLPLLKKIWRIDLYKEVRDHESRVLADPQRLVSINLRVANAGLFNKPLSLIRAMITDNFVVSRMYQDNALFVPDDETVLKEGGLLLAIAPKSAADELEVIFGEKSRVNFEDLPGELATMDIVVTHKFAALMKLGNIDELNRPDCQIINIRRSGLEIIPTPDVVLRIADIVTVVGTKKGLAEVASFLGNAAKRLDIPQLAPVFLGLFLGIILGNMPLPVPGIPIPVKMGLAGGPLIVALLISRFGNLLRIYNYTTYGANLMVRELGIALFLASIGLSTGSSFVETFRTGNGLAWIAIGFVITVVPRLVTAWIARYAAKQSFLEISGLLAGASTDPPALAFALQLSQSNIPSLTYATVYPLSMLARILAAEMVVLYFS